MKQTEATSENTLISPSKALQNELEMAKQQQGISLETLAEHLKIATHKLEVFEREAFDLTQLSSFERGYLRNYAGLLQVDLVPYESELQTQNQHASDLSTIYSVKFEKQNNTKIKFAFLAVLIIIFGALLAGLL